MPTFHPDWKSQASEDTRLKGIVSLLGPILGEICETKIMPLPVSWGSVAPEGSVLAVPAAGMLRHMGHDPALALREDTAGPYRELCANILSLPGAPPVDPSLRGPFTNGTYKLGTEQYHDVAGQEKGGPLIIYRIPVCFNFTQSRFGALVRITGIDGVNVWDLASTALLCITEPVLFKHYEFGPYNLSRIQIEAGATVYRKNSQWQDKPWHKGIRLGYDGATDQMCIGKARERATGDSDELPLTDNERARTFKRYNPNGDIRVLVSTGQRYMYPCENIEEACELLGLDPRQLVIDPEAETWTLILDGEGVTRKFNEYRQDREAYRAQILTVTRCSAETLQALRDVSDNAGKYLDTCCDCD